MLSEVPSGWEVCPLHGIAKIQMGETLIAKDLTGDGVPVFSAGRGSEPWGYTSRSRKSFRRGTIIIGARGTLGFPRLPDLDFYISTQTTIAVIPNAGIDARFLSAFLATVDYDRLGAQQAVPMLTIESLSSAKVPLPPLPEQKKIAAILSSVDEAIQATQAVIDQTRRVKEGLLQDLLTRGIGHTRFKQTEIGEIPEGWDVVTLREVVDSARKITYGIVQPGAHKPDGVPLIRGQNYIGGWEPVSKFYRVDPRLHAQYSRSTTRPGDVLLCIVGATTGASAVVPADLPEANITQTTARIAPGTRTTTGFLACYLQSRQGQSEVARLVKGSAQPGLNLADVERFRLPLPPIDEQRLIEMRVSTVDAALESDTAQSERLRRLKTGLLTDLLTGKVRVTP
jgi:type I restriction enzyme S subunit